MSGSVKVPAEWFERDDVEQVGADAAMLHLSALAYAARHLTNGHIPARKLRRLWPTDVDSAVEALTTAGWWEAAEDGFLIADWHTFILSSDEVDHIRRQTRERVERHRRHKAGDHSMCDRCSFVRRGNGVSNGVSNGVGNAPSEPNRTEPTLREVRRGEEVGGAMRSAGASRMPHRLQVGDSRLDDPTPWDVSIEIEDLSPEHCEITASPAVPVHDPGSWDEAAMEAGYVEFVTVAESIYASLVGEVHALRASHQCTPDTPPDFEACSAHLDDSSEPYLDMIVPTSKAGTWVPKFAGLFEKAWKRSST